MRALLELKNISKYKLIEAEFQRLLGMSAEWISGLQSGFAHPNKLNVKRKRIPKMSAISGRKSLNLYFPDLVQVIL
jgi:hypothetical protein